MDTCRVIPLLGKVQNRQIHRQEVAWGVPGAGGGRWGVTDRLVGVGNILEWDRRDGSAAL